MAKLGPFDEGWSVPDLVEGPNTCTKFISRAVRSGGENHGFKFQPLNSCLIPPLDAGKWEHITLTTNYFRSVEFCVKGLGYPFLGSNLQ